MNDKEQAGLHSLRQFGRLLKAIIRYFNNLEIDSERACPRASGKAKSGKMFSTRRNDETPLLPLQGWLDKIGHAIASRHRSDSALVFSMPTHRRGGEDSPVRLPKASLLVERRV